MYPNWDFWLENKPSGNPELNSRPIGKNSSNLVTLLAFSPSLFSSVQPSKAINEMC
jgi:hypothetical protein